MKFSHLFKANPYHDVGGRFTSKDRHVEPQVKEKKPKLVNVSGLSPKAAADKFAGLKAAKDKMWANTKTHWTKSGSESVEEVDDGDAVILGVIHQTNKKNVATAEGVEASKALIAAQYEAQGYVVVDHPPKNPQEVQIVDLGPDGQPGKFQAKIKESLTGELYPGEKQSAAPADEAPVAEKAPAKGKAEAKAIADTAKDSGVAPAFETSPPPLQPTAKDIDPTGSATGPSKKALKTVEALIKLGDRTALKKFLEKNSGNYNSKAKELAKAGLEYLDNLDQWKKDNNIGALDLSNLSGKKLEKAKALAEEFGAKYHDQTIAALKSLYEQKPAAASALLKPLESLEKKMLAAGMTPAQVAAVRGNAMSAFEAWKDELRTKSETLTKEIISEAWDKGVNITNFIPMYSIDDSLKAKVAQLKEVAGPYSFIPGVAYGKTLIGDMSMIVRQEKLLEMKDALTDFYRKNPDGTLPSDLKDGLSRIKNNLGSKMADQLDAFAKAESVQAAGGPKNLAEAIAAYKLSSFELGKTTAHSEDWQANDKPGASDFAKASVQAELSAALISKFGGSAKDVWAANMTSDGKDQYYEAKKTEAEKLSYYKTKITEHMSAGLMARYLGGDSGALATAYKLATEAKTAGISEGQILAAITKAKDSFEYEKANLGNSAKSDITGASYKYHMSLELKGADHPDTISAKKAFDSAVTLKSKFVGSDVASVIDSGKTAAAQVVKAQKAFASMSELAAKTVAEFDSNAADFKFVASLPAEQRAAWVSSQNKMVNKMDPTAQSVIRSYTGSEYKAINRQAGAAGTAKITGATPVKVSSGIASKIKAMDAAFAQVELGQPMTLRRAFAANYLLNQVGITTSHLSKVSEDKLQSMVGRVYKETAFSSTSTRSTWDTAYSDSAASFGKVIFNIRAPAKTRGVSVKALSSHGGENEVVLARGTTYMIRRVKRLSSSTVEIDVDIIGVNPDDIFS